MTTEKDEIQELKAWVEELQAQVLSAGGLAAMVADWTGAPPGVAVRFIHEDVRSTSSPASNSGVCVTSTRAGTETLEKGR